MIIGGMEVTCERKRIKHMVIRVLPPDGRVAVSAPLFVTDEAVRAFAESRAAWVRAAQKKMAERARPVVPSLQTGETHALWGRRYILEVAAGAAREGVSIAGDRMILSVRGDATPARRARVLSDWYRAQLKEALPAVARRCEERAGVRAEEWRVKDMRTRWGTCNALKKRIWLSVHLAKKPPECLEYVAVHELAHLTERGHGPAFRAHMDRLLPDWRAVKERLNSSV